MDNMEAGEYENRKAFEEVTTRNVRTVIDYSKATRDLVRESDKKVDHVEKLLQEQNKTIAQLRQQLAVVQGKLYNGGT